jgi:hypothetical protein
MKTPKELGPPGAFRRVRKALLALTYLIALAIHLFAPPGTFAAPQSEMRPPSNEEATSPPLGDSTNHIGVAASEDGLSQGTNYYFDANVPATSRLTPDPDMLC